MSHIITITISNDSNCDPDFLIDGNRVSFHSIGFTLDVQSGSHTLRADLYQAIPASAKKIELVFRRRDTTLHVKILHPEGTPFHIPLQPDLTLVDPSQLGILVEHAAWCANHLSKCVLKK